MISKVTGLSVDGAYWLAVVLNFAVVVVAIVWASKKYLPAVFRNRTGSIQNRSKKRAGRVKTPIAGCPTSNPGCHVWTAKSVR